MEGVYAELSLDLDGATIFQIEIEADGTEVVPGGRLVWFNPENQKVIEIGCSDSAIEAVLPADVYRQCVEDSRKIFEATRYDNRGTNEILIVHSKCVSAGTNTHACEWAIFVARLRAR